MARARQKGFVRCFLRGVCFMTSIMRPSTSRRAAAWSATARAKKTAAAAHDSSYLQLLVLSRDARKTVCIQIDKDIPRTDITGLSVSRDVLRRVLLAYAVRSGSEPGYCQGMSSVAALLLSVLREEDAFWALAYLIEDQLPPRFYSHDLIGLRAELRVLRSTVMTHLPALHEHIAAHSLSAVLDDVLLTPCLACLFTRELPLALVRVPALPPSHAR